MNKRVVQVITKLEFGGAQTSTLHTAEYLARKDYEVYLFTSPGYLSKIAERLEGVSLKYFPFRREINPYYDGMTFILLWKEFLKIRPHIVHTHSSKAGILGRWAAFLSRVPFIYHTIHGFPFHDYQPSFLRHFYVFLEKVTAIITSKLIAITKEDMKKGLREGIGRRKKYILIRDGIDFQTWRKIKKDKERKKKELGIRERKVVGNISCFKPQKNLLDFIRMASLLNTPDTGFVIVGDGKMRREIEREIERVCLQDRFYLLGWREDVDEIIQIFDVFVLTSLWEGLPKTLLEAFSAGIPVVANAVDGVKEMVKDGFNGFLVPPKDIWTLTKRVRMLLKDENLRKKMGRNAQNSLSEEFELRSMMEKLDNLYQGRV